MTAEFPTAVHALVYLHHKGAVVPSAELADNICTNPARVRKIMAALCRAALAFATEGRASGYHTGPEAGAVTLRQVADALGEVPVAVSWRSGDVDRECLVSSGMAAAMDGVYGLLNDRCRDALAELTIEQISRSVLIRKKNGGLSAADQQGGNHNGKPKV